MMAAASLKLEGITQEELQPVQPDLSILGQLGTDIRRTGGADASETNPSSNARLASSCCASM